MLDLITSCTLFPPQEFLETTENAFRTHPLWKGANEAELLASGEGTCWSTGVPCIVHKRDYNELNRGSGWPVYRHVVCWPSDVDPPATRAGEVHHD